MPEDTSGELPKIIDNNVNNNYGEWAFKSQLKLQGWDLWKYIEGPESTPPDIPPLREPMIVQATDSRGVTQDLETHGNAKEREEKIKEAAPWMAANTSALSKIASAVSSDQIHLVQNVPYAAQAWANLREYYRPFNSNRAQSIKKDIFAYQCGPNMDVAKWLNDLQRLYSLLGDMGTNNSLSDREFTCATIDNLPQDAQWRIYAAGLRARVDEYDAHQPPTPITSKSFFTSIRQEAWYRTKNDPQLPAHIFLARSDAEKRQPKRSRAADSDISTSQPAKRTRTTNDKVCTNPNCGRKGHDISECITYGGGNQGNFPNWWRGPWNLHLPSDQRTRANNVPPASHPAYARLSSAAHAANLTLYPDSTIVPLASSSHSHSTTDGNAHIFSVIAGGLPSFDTDQDNETIVATLPVLSEVIADADSTHSDFCHYDSGANRHVFNDQSAFELYHRIQPLMVKGFGHDLTTRAIGRGTVRLHAKCDDQTVTILLTNVLHIPAARSNLVSGIQLDKVGVSALLTDGTARLYLRGQKIADGAIYNEMFRLNVDIIRPVKSQSLLQRMTNPPLISRLGPSVATVSPERADFCIASWGTSA